MKRLLLCIFAIFSSFLLMTANGASYQEALVRVIVTYQDPDPGLPWRKRSPEVRSGYGVMLGESCILTTEGLVRNSTLIELQLPRSGSKITAVLETMDAEVNLALLKPEDKTALSNIEPAALAKAVPTTAEVTAIHIDETREVQVVDGQLQNLSVRSLPEAPYASSTLKMQTQIRPPGHGAPVFYRKKLAGIVMSQESDSNVSYLLPCSVIRRFLKDASEPPYSGVASAGFLWRPLVDPVHREYLNVSTPGIGILVLSCLAETGAMEVLRPNDVILRWNGKDVDELGYYEDDKFGRLPFSYMIKEKSLPGNTVPVLLVRDKKQITVQLPLTRWSNSSALIPENESRKPAEYLISGGIMIRELSAHYLRAHGSRWRDYMDSYIVHLYSHGKDEEPTKGDHILIISRVLPDPINVGYQHVRNRVITHVNGQAVRNMADIFKIRKEHGNIHRITIHGLGVDLVLDQEELNEADRRIARTYRIPALSYQRPKTEREKCSTVKGKPETEGKE